MTDIRHYATKAPQDKNFKMYCGAGLGFFTYQIQEVTCPACFAKKIGGRTRTVETEIARTGTVVLSRVTTGANSWYRIKAEGIAETSSDYLRAAYSAYEGMVREVEGAE